MSRVFVLHGAHVLATDIDVSESPLTEDEKESAAGDLTVVELDVTRPGAPEDISRRCKPDVLVHNVGHFLRPPRPFAEEGPAQWGRIRETNVDHVFAITAALLPGIVTRGRGGSVITMTTVEAFRAIPGHAAYSGAKAALTAWSRSLAVEYGGHGIRFNDIAPDLIETPQVPYHDLVSDADRWRWRHWVPLGRPGTPSDVAGAALFLASPLSAFVTGTTIHVDGGSHAAGGWFRRESGAGWTNRPMAP